LKNFSQEENPKKKGCIRWKSSYAVAPAHKRQGRDSDWANIACLANGPKTNWEKGSMITAKPSGPRPLTGGVNNRLIGLTKKRKDVGRFGGWTARKMI